MGVAVQREQRLAREHEEIVQKVELHIKQVEQAENERIAAADEFVRRQAELIEKRILPENLEEAILEALENPVDPEFAIDLQGNIYRGREVRSLKVAANERENILIDELKPKKTVAAAQNS